MKIALVAMPFLPPQLPSLGLTQIKGRLDELFKERIGVRLAYLNHDFFEYFGADLYSKIDGDSNFTFINDWIFRQEAYDDIEDNMKAYFARFYPGKKNGDFCIEVTEKRSGLRDLLDALITRYGLHEFDIVGVNATFSTVPGMALCRHIKKKHGDIVTVMGGAGLYKEMGLALSRHYPHVDYICSGSGLVSFPKLVSAIMSGDDSRDRINGIFSKRSDGTSGMLSDELDINHDIVLDYDDFFESLQKKSISKHMRARLFLETSRGCYWRKCTFCGLNEDQLKYRVMQPEKAVKEINTYIKKYDTDIEMVDNVMPKHYIRKVLPYLEIPHTRTIMYEVRADLSEEDIEMFSRMGVRQFSPGIETLSSDVHELMNKGVNLFQCIHTLKLCLKFGLRPYWNILVGFPGMNGDMYDFLGDIIPKLTHLFPPVVLTPVRFDRYSTYWMQQEKYGLDLNAFSPYGYVHPYGDDFLSDIAYYFEDKNYSSQRYKLLFEHYGALNELVQYWKRRWENDDFEHLPKLYISERDGHVRIHDTRSEAPGEYEIPRGEAEILHLLEQPQTIDSLHRSLETSSPDEIQRFVQSLERNGLIFKEGERYMSLVMHDRLQAEIESLLQKFQQIDGRFHRYVKI